jgi:hypothetical protein
MAKSQLVAPVVAHSFAAAPASTEFGQGDTSGLSAGYGIFDGSVTSDDNSFTNGLIAGYDYDFGD